MRRKNSDTFCFSPETNLCRIEAPPPARSGRDFPPSAPLPLPQNRIIAVWYPSIVKPPRLLVVLLALLPAFFLSGVADAAPETAAKKPGASQSARKKTVPRKTAVTGKTAGTAKSTTPSKKTPAKKSTSGKRSYARPATQQQPDSDRIREIQQALQDKGYSVEATGVWGQTSIEALKKFQEDQNLSNSSGRGKLDSLTLITLGLGPKRDSTEKPVTPEPKAIPEGK